MTIECGGVLDLATAHTRDHEHKYQATYVVNGSYIVTQTTGLALLTRRPPCTEKH